MVLIETYWNVKASLTSNVLFRRVHVLIETYWNVKVNPSGVLSISRLRINRNILECKVIFAVGIRGCLTRINRNILECKVR